MRRETVLTLVVVVVVLGYLVWGTRNIIRTWEAEPNTPAPLAALTATPSAAPSTVPAVAAPAVAAPSVAATVVAEAAQTGAASAPLGGSPAATRTVSVPEASTPSQTLTATALAPVTAQGAGQGPVATGTSQPAPTLSAPALSAPAPDTQSPATVAAPTLAAPATPLTPAPAPAVGPRRSIPGLTYPAIRARLSTAFEMECSGPNGSDLLAWQCVATNVGGTVRMTAVINGLDAERIISITGVVSQSGPADVASVSMFLGFVAALPFEGTQAQQAQAWVVDHLAGEGRTAIGGSAGVPPTLLSLSGTPAVRTLDVYAPQPLDVSR